MLRLFSAIFTILISIPLLADNNEVEMHWSFIGKESEAFDSMMEKAAFLDIPRRDLLTVVSGHHISPHDSPARQASARICYWKGWVLLKEDPDSAASLAGKAIELCDSSAYPYDHARFSLLKADVMRLSGNLAEAYSLYKENISVFEKFNDKFWIGKALVCIGVIMQDLGEFHEALRNYEEAQSMFNSAGSESCLTKNKINIANLHYILGRKEESVNCLDGIEKNRFVLSDSVFMANVLVSRFHISEYNDTAAIAEAYKISVMLNNDPLSVLTRLYMGLLRHNEGREMEGIKFLKSAMNTAKKLNDYSNLRNIYSGLVTCHKSIGSNDSAATYNELLLSLNDSIYRHEQIDGLKKAEHLATITRYEQRIHEEADANEWRMTLTLFICGALTVILVLSLYLVWMSRKKSESDRRLEEEKNRRLELLNSKYSLEIKAKEKELSSTTFMMVQKNKQLKELAEQIEMIKENGTQNDTAALRQTIDRQLSADDDWRYFKMRFEKVHPDFFGNIKTSYPSLSKNDLRLCSYIRVGMSSKEIAQVMSVKPDTVNTSRYRIRKKMNLSPEESIESILEKF